MGSVFIGVMTAFTFTNRYLPLLWFTLFAILGGISIGMLNGRKARQQTRYKNEYTAYGGMMFSAILFLGIYYLFFALYKVEERVIDGILFDAAQVVYVAVGGALMGLFGIGLAVANSLAE